MDAAKKHPAIALFDSLLDFRSHRASNTQDWLTRFLYFCVQNFQHSSSQLFQDLFVLFILQLKEDGVFVEFGATDGVNLSNTFLLERQFGWKGVLAEPAKCWHDALKTNRKASIDLRCVWAETGRKLEFKETSIAELSTLSELTEKDFNREGRRKGKKYFIDTISLNDLLEFHNIPKIIDYLSIDTEGSEFAIINKFNFEKYDVTIITVEHNYCVPDRENIKELLSTKGFIRVLESLSKWDDWYIKRSLIGS